MSPANIQSYFNTGGIANAARNDPKELKYSVEFKANQFKRAVNPPIDAQYPILQFPGFFAGFQGTADVINSSWGFTDPIGTDGFTKVIDGLARKFPHTTMVIAALRLVSSGSVSARSSEVRIIRRMRKASSIVFKPGANCSQSL